MKKMPKRQLRSIDDKFSHIGVLNTDAREFIKGHRVKPAFRAELKAYLDAAVALHEAIHLSVTGGA